VLVVSVVYQEAVTVVPVQEPEVDLDPGEGALVEVRLVPVRVREILV